MQKYTKCLNHKSSPYNLTICIKGTCFLFRRENESPQCDCVNKFMPPQENIQYPSAVHKELFQNHILRLPHLCDIAQIGIFQHCDDNTLSNVLHLTQCDEFCSSLSSQLQLYRWDTMIRES